LNVREAVAFFKENLGEFRILSRKSLRGKELEKAKIGKFLEKALGRGGLRRL
jgi:hypothetical protein